jgi:hypothetical protein
MDKDSLKRAFRALSQGVGERIRDEWHFLSRKLLEERKLGTKMANIAI